MGTTEKVREKARQLPLGQPVSVKTFAAYGSRAAVDQALSRLVKEGVLSRPVRGIYLRPRISPYIGEVPVEPMKVAAAIAEEFGGVVQVHGAEAARRLGFNTQVPARPIFLTSGPNRRFHLGQMEVTLKHVSPRKLALAGSMAGVALTALWYLGKDNVSPQTIERVRTRLAPEEFEALRTATQIMPGWMRDAFVGHEGKSVEICPEAAKQTEPPTRPKESQTLSAQELLRMPRTQRMKILDEAAIVARGDYSQHPELTNFEALGAADLHE